jgi:protocatechuate 3,4-dioxygenase beta subunit
MDRDRSRRAGWFVGAALLGAAAAQEPRAAAARPITGHVYDEHGKPFAGAAVGAFGPQQFVDTALLLAHPTTTTAADGSYAIAVDTTFASGNVVIAAPRRQACAIRVGDEPVRDGGDLADALLVPGASLTGRVRDATGAPLAGVRIAITSSIADRWISDVTLLAGAISDAQGIFTVPCVPRTGMRLCACADGYLTEARLVAQQTPADLTLRSVGMVRGKVVDTRGAPVAGASVYGVTVETRDDEAPPRSAADGSFALTVPTTGRFRVAADCRVTAGDYRQFSSGLLHGPADGVVVVETKATGNDVRAFEVVVVDAATKAPIDQFGLSQDTGNVQDTQRMLFHHSLQRREYRGKASLSATDRESTAVVVDAPGHAFEVVTVPDDLTGPLVVALGPEAVLTGRVVDAETNQPIAGVAVRALPAGGGIGEGGTAEQCGPKTDAHGVYRVGGLRPGSYSVQAHAADRVASAPVTATVEVGRATTLDLEVPKRRWLEFELTGPFPEGSPCRVSWGPATQDNGPRGFEHSVPEPAPFALTHKGTYRIGPVGRGTRQLQIWLPSRARVGTGTAVPLADLDPDRGPVTVAMPDLAREFVRGRVLLAEHVPSERVAVVANKMQEKGPAPFAPWFERPNIAGIDDGGNFVLDLPTGSYRLQLFDVETGIAFHTEEQPMAVAKGMAPIALRPECHWLELDLVPEQRGDDVVLQSFGVELPWPADSAGSAFLHSWGYHWGSGGDIEQGSVEFRVGAAHQRWLVPRARLALTARQTSEILQPWAGGFAGKVVAAETLDVTLPVHHVTLTIPPPPSDEVLLQQKR